MKNKDTINVAELRSLHATEPYRDTFIEVKGRPVKLLRPWQNEVVQDLAREKLRLIIAAMGAGKTTGIQVLEALNPHRTLIAAPQRTIGNGFFGNQTFHVEGRKAPCNWKTTQSLNLCNGNKKSVKQIIDWLEGNDPYPCLTTHQALCLAYSRMGKERFARCISTVSLVIDETHHLAEHNRAGQVVSIAIDYAAKVTLATATYSRGDLKSILNEENFDKFSIYTLPFDRHLASLNDLESINLYFDFTPAAWYNHAIDHIVDRRATILYLAHDVLGENSSPELREKEVESILLKIAKKATGRKLVKAKYDIQDGIIFLDIGESEPLRIIDLATQHRQKHGEKAFRSGRDFDLVIANKMGQEGWDWPKCERVIIVGASKSVPMFLQRMGRTVRDYPGKRVIDIINLIPRKPQANVADKLADFVHYQMLILLGRYEFAPPAADIVVRGKGKRQQRISVMSYVFSGSQERLEYLCRVSEALFRASNTEDADEAEERQIVGRIVDDVAPTISEDIRERLIDSTLRQILRTSASSLGIDVSFLREAGYRNLREETQLTASQAQRQVLKANLSIREFERLKEYIRDCEWASFEEAREIGINSVAKSAKEWQNLHSLGGLPRDVPFNPDKVYKGKGWNGWGDYLGTGNHKGNWRSFKEAQEFVQSKNLKNNEEWQEYCKLGKKPKDIPSNPDKVYADEGWNGMPDFLGNDNGKIYYRSFKEARKFVQNLELKGEHEWREYSKSGKRPKDIPSAPHTVYKGKGWNGWGDYLGTGNRKGNWRSFKEVRAFARSLGIKNREEWYEYCKSGKKPKDIPFTPHRVYKDKGWNGWSDFFAKLN